jgi:hypothetical protein
MHLNIQEMTVADKLQAMEMLWDNLCRTVQDIESPPWHEHLLQKREEQLRQGKDSFVDWEQAKKEIRKTAHEN